MGMLVMETETRNMVEVYVRHGNRKALKDLLAQRKRVIVGLNDLAFNYDTSEPIAQCEQEIALVKAALAKAELRRRQSSKKVGTGGNEKSPPHCLHVSDLK
jgi:hypothetical protein